LVHFIRKQSHVEDADKVSVIRQDAPAARPELSDSGILYLIGLPGSGKSALAALAAQALGVPAAELPLGNAADALTDLLAQGPAVIAVPHTLLADAALRARLQATGRVLYLMANADTLARRLAATPEEEGPLRERLARQLTACEPWFMQTLHLLVPADGPLDEVLAMTLERMRF